MPANDNKSKLLKRGTDVITKIVAALKSNLAVTLGAVGVVGVAAAAGTAGWIYANRADVQEVAPPRAAAPEQAAPEPAQRQARLPDQEAPAAGPPAAAQPEAPAPPTQTPPAFDVVRVQADGDAVVAGQAEPGARIVLFAGSKPVGETQADVTGSWVMVLDKPLPVGASDLWLSAEKAGLPNVRSIQSVTVVIDAARNEQPLVVVQDESGSRVLQKPKPVAVAKLPEAPRPPAPAMSAPPPSAAAPPAETAAPPEPAQAPPPAAAAGAPRVPVSIEAADYDVEGWLHMSGLATPSATVRLYYDNGYVGDTEADAEGRWSLSFKRSLDGATHTVRADDVAPGSGRILARSEVSFIAELPEGERRKLAEAAETARSEAPATPPAAMRPGAGEPAAQAPAEPVTEATAPPPAQPGEAPASQGPDIAAVEAAAEPSPAPAAAEAAAGAPQIPSKVTVVRGDNLWRISRTFYGRGIRYTTIFQANRDQIRDPHWIYPGQVFLIPRLKKADESVN